MEWFSLSAIPGVPQAGRGQSSWGSGGARSDSRPGRAPAPWQPPGLTRQRREPSWRFTLPAQSSICHSPWKRHALKQVQAAKAAGCSPGGTRRGFELSLPGRTPRSGAFLSPETPFPSTGAQSRGAARHPWSRRQEQGAGACPGHAVPGAPGPCPRHQPRRSQSSSGLKRAGETGPVPGAGRAIAHPCPLRERIPLVSGMAARPSPHSPQPAASTPRHRPFQIRSIIFIYSFTPHYFHLFKYILGVFFLSPFRPFPGSAKRCSPALLCPPAAAGAPLQPGRCRLGPAGTRPEPGKRRGQSRAAGDNRDSPSTAAFDRFSVVSFAKHHPNRDLPTATPTVHPRKIFASLQTSPSGSAGAWLFPAGADSWGSLDDGDVVGFGKKTKAGVVRGSGCGGGTAAVPARCSEPSVTFIPWLGNAATGASSPRQPRVPRLYPVCCNNSEK